jgi:two-component system CheB/CheR fusion protein
MAPGPPLYVGIGTSAGGGAGLTVLFNALCDTEGTAFIVVARGGGQEELCDQLASATGMPVRLAEDGQPVEPGTIYLCPGGRVIAVAEGRLRLTAGDAADRQNNPVDHFFTSLAESQGENCVAVILSGESSDGTIGAKVVTERGGIVIAQADTEEGAPDSEMPQSAMASGLVDFAEALDDIPARLVQLRDSAGMLDAIAGSDQNARPADEMRQVQGEVSHLLRSHTGHDFSGYKARTFMRRVARRMKVMQIEEVEHYLQHLHDEPAEVLALFRDLLINVTNFFRDEDAFAALRSRVLPALFEGRGADETIRLWVPGCATGEEVYSLGILMREYMDGAAVCPKVQIFATDIDEEALSAARAGRYPEALLSSVSPDRLSRFFRRDGSAYVVRKEVREMCIFSPHSVISDPPFSRMDLVSCRNLLIYFGPDLQNFAIPTFHYALKPGGFLFLGTSEGIGRHGDLFVPVDKHHRIFQSRDNGGRSARLPPALAHAMEHWGLPGKSVERRGHLAGSTGPELRQRVEAQVLERHAPPHVVVARDGEILFFSSGTGRFLEMPRGAPNRQLHEMARRELRGDLRAAQREAMENATPSRRRAVLDDGAGRAEVIELTVEPLEGPDGGETVYLVLFDALGTQDPVQDAEAGVAAVRESEAALEREVIDLRERMQSTVEEYETALEELRASNEELVSANEEAQSTNEELEASKEEMQSLNQELNTVNAELAKTVEELDRASTDQKNLYDATEIAAVFLDGDMGITNFTPAAASFFNLRESDLGRPLTDLAGALHYPEMEELVRQVFRSGEPIERRQTAEAEDTRHLVRLMPYRNRDDAIVGVVVTIVDITTLAKAEEQREILIAELNHRVKNMLTVVISIANSTHRAAPSPEEFAGKLISRLHGMARAYSLLSEANWSGVTIREIVRGEGEAFGTEQLDAAGPEIRLNTQQALALGMIIHELATNSAKYGAFSTDRGRVHVEWDTTRTRIRLRWCERGGPEVQAPTSEGFGMVLVQGQATEQLLGEINFDFDPGGLTVTLTFPLVP